MIEHPRILLSGVDGTEPFFVPVYEHEGDAGADLCSAIDFTLAPFERFLVPTGIRIAMPLGYVALVHPRSGLAVRQGVTILNTPGTIDAGYRGEIKVLLINCDAEHTWEFHRGDRIAQLVFQRCARAGFETVAELPDSARGIDGFGSTGIRDKA